MVKLSITNLSDIYKKAQDIFPQFIAEIYDWLEKQD